MFRGAGWNVIKVVWGSYWDPLLARDTKGLLRKLAPRSLVEKTRYKLRYRGHVWSVDEFRGRHAGLVLAEIELAHPCALFDVPDWVGQDVTSQERYSNSCLAQLAGPTEVQAEIDRWGPSPPVRRLMDGLVLGAIPASGRTSDLAVFALYVRSHWLRMPPVMLAKHLWTKWRKA